MRDQERNWISQHQRSAFTKTFRNFALACWIRVSSHERNCGLHCTLTSRTIFSVTNIVGATACICWTTCSIRTCRKILCNHLSFLIFLHNSQIYRLCLYPIERLDFLYYLLPFKRFGIFFMLLFVDILPFLKRRDISLWLFLLRIVVGEIYHRKLVLIH